MNSSGELAHRVRKNFRSAQRPPTETIRRPTADASQSLRKVIAARKKKGRPWHGDKLERARPFSSRVGFDLETELARVMGADLTVIDGIKLMTVQTIYSELGPDLSRPSLSVRYPGREGSIR